MNFPLRRLATMALRRFAGCSLRAQKGVDLESEMPPNAPTTVHIAPGGKIIYRCANEVNGNGLVATMVDRPGHHYTQ